jgi:hypothetical protein
MLFSRLCPRRSALRVLLYWFGSLALVGALVYLGQYLVHVYQGAFSFD